jgi:Transmembrane amino acid transporter protein
MLGSIQVPLRSYSPQLTPLVHWGTWLGCTLNLASIAFVLAEAIPIFNYLIALTGSICFAPLAIALPGWLWLHDHGVWRRGSPAKQITYWLHWGMILLGAFVCVGGTYGVVMEIKEAYASGLIGRFIFSLSTFTIQVAMRDPN